MRQTYSGTGANTTTAALAFLRGANQNQVRNLYIIGNPGNPYSLFLTDHDAPLAYGLYPQQTFQPATIKRSSIPCKVGLDSDSVTITWSTAGGSFSPTVSAANPRTLAMQGYYDNWPVTIFAGLMPTPGDVNTIGCTTLWRGIVGATTVDRARIQFSVDSLMVLLDQKVPTNVIEATNTLASYTAVTPPTGFSEIPSFTVFGNKGDTVIYGDVLPPFSTGHIFSANAFQGGYLIFLPGNGATLPQIWGAIAASSTFTDGLSHTHNQFQIYSPLPWPPTPYSGGSGDTFLVSASVQTTGGNGFQYVPAPVTAV